MKVRQGEQGWTDAQVVLSLVLLNLAGGDYVNDVRILEGDEGFSRVLERVQTHGTGRREHRELESWWRIRSFGMATFRQDIRRSLSICQKV